MDGGIFLYGTWKVQGKGISRSWLLLMLCVLAGVCLGGWLVHLLSGEEMEQLGSFFEDLSSLTQQEGVGFWALFWAVLWSGIQCLGAVGLLGMTILAPILVPLLLVYRGVTIGFCGVCILHTVQEGAFLSLLSNVAIYHMFSLPILLWWSAESIQFSKGMLAQMRGQCRRESEREQLPLYFLRLVLCSGLLALGALLSAPLILWLSGF